MFCLLESLQMICVKQSIDIPDIINNTYTQVGALQMKIKQYDTISIM